MPQNEVDADQYHWTDCLESKEELDVRESGIVRKNFHERNMRNIANKFGGTTRCRAPDGVSKLDAPQYCVGTRQCHCPSVRFGHIDRCDPHSTSATGTMWMAIYCRLWRGSQNDTQAVGQDRLNADREIVHISEDELRVYEHFSFRQETTSYCGL